jgi:hypothetical protein
MVWTDDPPNAGRLTLASAQALTHFPNELVHVLSSGEERPIMSNKHHKLEEIVSAAN